MPNFINTKMILLILLFMSALALSACRMWATPEKLADLSPFGDKIVYIEEDGAYKPYYALRQDDDAVLMLRQLLLPEVRRYNENKKMGAYYATSEIDEFLNTDFIDRLSAATRDNVVTAKIEITALDSIGSTGDQKETIERKVFLLSHHELGLREIATAVKEGRPIDFFKDTESRIAYLEGDGDACGWWLRTPSTWYDSVVFSYSYNGTLGGAGIEFDNGIRPAFYLKADTPLEERTDIVNDKSVFVVK